MFPERLGAHIPWARLDEFLELVVNLRLVPEVAIKGPELDLLDSATLRLTAQRLEQADIRPTVHAPFFDLNPGALDPLVRKTTYRRLSQALELANQLNAHLMVIHPGYDRWRYPNLEQEWIKLACESFPPLLELAQKFDCRLAIENIYEETPDTLTSLVNNLNSDWLGHCFDVGHWQLFGKTPMHEWLQSISCRIFHLHLHDNHGVNDDHLPVGEGMIDFSPVFKFLSTLTKSPSITLEAHSPEHLHRSLAQVTERIGS